MTTIAIATCRKFPAPTPGDRLLADALSARSARVDVIVHESRVSLVEVELVEPELFFTLCPEAAGRLADHLIGAV